MGGQPNEDAARVFRGLMDVNAWGSVESSSGIGSELRYTEAVRAALPRLVRDLGVRSVLDVPCGDWNWMRTVDLEGVDYVGADVVASVVEENTRRHARDGVRFTRLDVVTDRLPRADLVVCRDCLVHLPDELVIAALRNIARSRCRYVLLTTFPGRGNEVDITTGEWRPVDLEAAPFGLPAPRMLIDERFDGDGGRYQDKSLGLWHRRDLRRAARPSRWRTIAGARR